MLGYPTIILATFCAVAINAIPAENYENLVTVPEENYLLKENIRLKRSPETEEEKRKREQGWKVQPGVGGDGQNTQAGVQTVYTGEKHDFNAGVNQVFQGPNRGRPTWHVGGTFRFRRSPETEEEKRKREQGWKVQPGVGGDGQNTQASVQTVYTGEKHDFNAGVSQVFQGPGRGRPTWHVGGTFRFRRSPETEEEKRKREQGWKVQPGVGGDGQNTQAGVQTVYTGEKHDFNAGVSQVFQGPGRGRPTWHVGGTFRFRRSPETEEEKRKREQGWKVQPGVGGDGQNTQAGVQTVYTGEKHDFNAGVSQVFHGPNRGRPSWHVGGTFRFRRSPETEEEKRKREQGWKVQPGVGGDGQNTQAGVQTVYTGEKHDFNAGVNQVFQGPNRGRPTWHVGGTFRFRRSPETEEEKRKREQGWKVQPGVGGDGQNTQAGVQTVYTGEKHDFNAGVSQVFHGPGRGRPSWHVGGTFRFKRSLETVEEPPAGSSFPQPNEN